MLGVYARDPELLLCTVTFGCDLTPIHNEIVHTTTPTCDDQLSPATLRGGSLHGLIRVVLEPRESLSKLKTLFLSWYVRLVEETPMTVTLPGRRTLRQTNRGRRTLKFSTILHCTCSRRKLLV